MAAVQVRRPLLVVVLASGPVPCPPAFCTLAACVRLYASHILLPSSLSLLLSCSSRPAIAACDVEPIFSHIIALRRYRGNNDWVDDALARWIGAPEVTSLPPADAPMSSQQSHPATADSMMGCSSSDQVEESETSGADSPRPSSPDSPSPFNENGGPPPECGIPSSERDLQARVKITPSSRTSAETAGLHGLTALMQDASALLLLQE